MKLLKPRITARPARDADFETAVRTAQAEETEITALDFRAVTLPDGDFSRVRFHDCVFENCRFTEGNFKKTEFIDVRFRLCDFSGGSFESGYFNRCEFLSCKGMGGNYYRAFLQDVLLSDCSFRYANFTLSKWRNVSAAQSSFAEAALEECSFKNLALDHADLTRVQFFKTILKDVDFTTSVIDGISVSPYELRGAKVNAAQAAELAKLLGVIVL